MRSRLEIPPQVPASAAELVVCRCKQQRSCRTATDGQARHGPRSACFWAPQRALAVAHRRERRRERLRPFRITLGRRITEDNGTPDCARAPMTGAVIAQLNCAEMHANGTRLLHFRDTNLRRELRTARLPGNAAHIASYRVGLRAPARSLSAHFSLPPTPSPPTTHRPRAGRPRRAA